MISRCEAVASLVGSLRWAVDVYRASVRIERMPAPGPVPSAEEVINSLAHHRLNQNRIHARSGQLLTIQHPRYRHPGPIARRVPTIARTRRSPRGPPPPP